MFGATSSIATPETKEAAHHFTVGADIVLFSALIWYVAKRCNRDWWGPLVLVSCSVTLVMLDPTRHLLLDHGGVFFKDETLAMYGKGGVLTPVGRCCQICTVIGLTGLFSGVLWALWPAQAVSNSVRGDEKSIK